MFYHASNTGGLKQLLPLSVNHDGGKAVCYFTTCRAYALFYLRDMEINHVTCGMPRDGVVTYYEEFPRQLEKIYGGRSGWLYHCDDNGSITEGPKSGVWVSVRPIVVINSELVDNVYEEILAAE